MMTSVGLLHNDLMQTCHIILINLEQDRMGEVGVQLTGWLHVQNQALS